MERGQERPGKKEDGGREGGEGGREGGKSEHPGYSCIFRETNDTLSLCWPQPSQTPERSWNQCPSRVCTSLTALGTMQGCTDCAQP